MSEADEKEKPLADLAGDAIANTNFRARYALKE
jgi:hypothetical protein